MGDELIKKPVEVLLYMFGGLKRILEQKERISIFWTTLRTLFLPPPSPTVG